MDLGCWNKLDSGVYDSVLILVLVHECKTQQHLFREKTKKVSSVFNYYKLKDVEHFEFFKSIFYLPKNVFTNFKDFWKFLKVWTASQGAQIIALINVRGVLNTSCHRLFNGVKKQNPKVIFDCMNIA